MPQNQSTVQQKHADAAPTEIQRAAQPYIEILHRLRQRYPTLRDDQLFLYMLILEERFEDSIVSIATSATQLFVFTEREIASAAQ